MPLRSRTIRVSDATWAHLKREADLEGISVNQWITEATVARLTYARMRRNEKIAEDFDAIFECLRQLRDD